MSISFYSIISTTCFIFQLSHAVCFISLFCENAKLGSRICLSANLVCCLLGILKKRPLWILDLWFCASECLLEYGCLTYSSALIIIIYVLNVMLNSVFFFSDTSRKCFPSVFCLIMANQGYRIQLFKKFLSFTQVLYYFHINEGT